MNADNPQDATATTYAVQCKPGTDASDCGFPGVFTLTEGPARAAYTLTPEKDENGTLALCVSFYFLLKLCILMFYKLIDL